MPIPLVKTYHTKGDKMWVTREPLYRLKTKEEEKRYQDSLGSFLGFYYGTGCYKCHDVYPRLMTEQTFVQNCYYICLVCGKESEHKQMPWMAKESWQEINKPYEQMTIFDLLQ